MERWARIHRHIDFFSSPSVSYSICDHPPILPLSFIRLWQGKASTPSEPPTSTTQLPRGLPASPQADNLGRQSSHCHLVCSADGLAGGEYSTEFFSSFIPSVGQKASNPKAVAFTTEFKPIKGMGDCLATLSGHVLSRTAVRIIFTVWQTLWQISDVFFRL